MKFQHIKHIAKIAKKNKKSPVDEKRTRDSDACMKARCERNLSSHRCFI